MSMKDRGKIGSKAEVRVIYIGTERFTTLSESAIDVSYRGKRQITASQMAQYVVDNYLEVAMEKLLKEIQSS
ncbi:hypothetical protein PSTH1771_25830 [Pseudomonas syringae pv. theae]|uniref:hypothetical protein n=1 Tax=Pseudomonas syringae TaxID=317 RepID=UPI0023D4E288|nr:hypothetical protein [Pseudomonas syringae]GKS08504.1 hypothetical protein PSTH1771_25830 [Pseudomonas syringae pv. theae]